MPEKKRVGKEVNSKQGTEQTTAQLLSSVLYSDHTQACVHKLFSLQLSMTLKDMPVFLEGAHRTKVVHPLRRINVEHHWNCPTEHKIYLLMEKKIVYRNFCARLWPHQVHKNGPRPKIHITASTIDDLPCARKAGRFNTGWPRIFV